MILESDADLALIQEISKPPAPLPPHVLVDGEPWNDQVNNEDGVWRSAVVRLSDRVQVEWLRPDIACLTIGGLKPIIVVSFYAIWTKPHESTGSSWILADASAHRLISDISHFIGSVHGHRIIVAGDFNHAFGVAWNGSAYWKGRDQTVIDRMHALGLQLIGPHFPNGRRSTNPSPYEPADSTSVPTFHTNRVKHEAAQLQLDYVFASNSIANKVTAKALNEADEWGPSDHCRLIIDVGI